MADQEKTGPVQGAAAPVATGAAAAQNPAVASSPAAKATVAKHGGLRGGKKRDDGLTPGSPEAAEADRKKDAERKQRERDEARTALEATQRLPSKLDGLPNPNAAPSGSPVAGAVSEARPFVPWTPDIVRPFTAELIPVVEAVDANGLVEDAKKKLPEAFVKEVKKDAGWPAAAKKILDGALPRLAAKYLNKTGISAENADEVAVGSAVVMILHSRNALKDRMSKIAEELKHMQKKNEPARSAGTVAAAGNPS